MLPTPMPAHTVPSTHSQPPTARLPAQGAAGIARPVEPQGPSNGPDGQSDTPRRVTPPLPYADWLRMLSGYQDGAASARTDQAVPAVTERAPRE